MSTWLVFKFRTLDVISISKINNKKKSKGRYFFTVDNKATERETSEMTRSDNHNTVWSVKMKYFNWWLDDSFLQS